MIDLVAPGLTFLGVVVAGIFAYRGTKTTDQTDQLSKAAGLYSDYADKMENRVTTLEQKLEEQETVQAELSKRQQKSEKEAETYKAESTAYRSLILEVIQWVTEILDWEARQYEAPAPHMTLRMVLARLTSFVKDQQSRDSKTYSNYRSDDSDGN